MAIEWTLVLFSLLAGCGGCAFAYLGLSGFMLASTKSRFQIALTAFIITVFGGFCSVAHLASPENVMAAVWNIGSFSGISVELILIGIVCIFMVVYMVLVKREVSESGIKVVGAIGAIFGLLLAFFTGHGYVIESRALWDTEMLPLAYLGTALAFGAFTYAVCALVFKVETDEVRKMAIPVGVGAVIGPVTVLGYIFAVGFEQACGNPLILWGGLIVCGVAATLICGVLVMVRKQYMSSLPVLCAGLVFSAIGALALRAFMWAMGNGFLDLFEVAMTTRVIN